VGLLTESAYYHLVQNIRMFLNSDCLLLNIYVNSAFHLSGIGKSSRPTGLSGWGQRGLYSLVSGGR